MTAELIQLSAWKLGWDERGWVDWLDFAENERAELDLEQIAVFETHSDNMRVWYWQKQLDSSTRGILQNDRTVQSTPLYKMHSVLSAA